MAAHAGWHPAVQGARASAYAAVAQAAAHPLQMPESRQSMEALDCSKHRAPRAKPHDCSAAELAAAHVQGVSALVQNMLAPTAHCAPLQVSHVLKKGQTTPAGVELPVAEPGTEGQYFFYDKVHPSGVGVGGWVGVCEGRASGPYSNPAASALLAPRSCCARAASQFSNARLLSPCQSVIRTC